MKTANKIRIMAFAGVIIAMNIVLARLVAINIGPTLRITVSQTPVYLAGFWFGISAILAGMIPGVFRHVMEKKPELWKVLGVLAIHGVVGALGFTCIGLHIYYGTPWSVLYATRIVQTIMLTAVNSVLVFFLYKSPLTGFVKRSMAEGKGRIHQINTADKSMK